MSDHLTKSHQLQGEKKNRKEEKKRTLCWLYLPDFEVFANLSSKMMSDGCSRVRKSRAKGSP